MVLAPPPPSMAPLMEPPAKNWKVSSPEPPARFSMPAKASPFRLPASAAEMTQVFAVKGMTCALCGKAIEKSVRGVEGVRDVRVDQETERVTVVTSAELDRAALIEAIESAGSYTAHPIGQSDG